MILHSSPTDTGDEMPLDKPRRDRSDSNKALTDALRERQERQKAYREKALKILPWVCAWCGREFSGTRLRELTVHHKDYDHDNNPPDGSNWELLCLYCHEQMHEGKTRDDIGMRHSRKQAEPLSTYKPFANLDALLKQKQDARPDEGD